MFKLKSCLRIISRNISQPYIYFKNIRTSV